MELISFDDCNICGEQHDTVKCPLLEMAQKIKDEQVPSRALLTLPQTLVIKNTTTGKAAVFAKETIASGTQFGPLEAPFTNCLPSQCSFPLKVFRKDGSSVFLNTTDENHCNWMCLVTPATDLTDQNIIAYQLLEDIYFSTQKAIEAGEELKVGYAPPYGKKMETSLLQTSQSDSQADDVMSSVPHLKEAIPVKRKRGRPPKHFHGGKAKDLGQKIDQAADDLEPVDEAVVRSLGARELGIKEDQQEWQCSQCSAIFADALDFAKHLQEHYKPAIGIGRGRSKSRGRSRGWSLYRNWGYGIFRGRRRGRPRGSRHHGWSFRQKKTLFADTESDIRNGSQEDDANSTELQQLIDKPVELPTQVDNTDGEKLNYVESEPASEIPLDSSLNGSLDDNPSALASVSISSTSPSQTSLCKPSIPSPFGYSRRGRKRKSEVISKEKEDSYNDKQFRCVQRQSSETAAQKYNLRTTRKALVFSDDELEGGRDPDDDIMDDDDDDDDFKDDDEDDVYFNLVIPQSVNDGTHHIMKSVDAAEQTVCEGTENAVITTVRPTVVTLSGATTCSDVNTANRESADDCNECLIEESLTTSVNTRMELEENDVSVSVENTGSGVNNLIHVQKGGEFPEQICTPDDNSKECTVLGLNKDDEPQDLWTNKKFIENLQGKIQYHKRPGRYKCDLCGKGFNKTLYLYRHIKKHTGEFTCPRCHRVFARKENMLKHNCPSLIDTAEEKKFEYNCWYCNKSFGTDRMLKRHMAKHTGEYTCKDCNKSYSTKDILLNHACPVKPRSSQFKCSVCGKTFTKHNYLLKHFPVHTGQHACPICGKWLRSIDSLTNHMRMCGQVKEIEMNGKASCPNCHEIFTDVAEFRRHQYEHTHIHTCDNCGARFRNRVSLGLHVCQGKCTIPCDVCGKLFSSSTNMQRHKLTHGEPALKCSDCGRGFFRKDALMKHSCEQAKQPPDVPRQKKKVSLMPLICEICGSMFSSTSSLNVHKNLHGEKKFSCEVCGKRFHRKDLLLEHHAVHGDPTYPCTTCNKLFKTKKSLDVHMMIHDGVKRFKCATCGKEFFQKGNLQKHEETHNNERKYSCTICQKSFSTKEYLRVHILEHTWGRIYSCGICRRSFVKEHQLRSHHRMFHSNQTYICRYCGISLKLRHSLKRHLKKKHSDFEEEWKSPEAVNDMLVTKEQSSEASQTTELHLQVPDLTSSQGAEMLLAVAGIDNEEIREALASGRAQIKQGALPNTIEISVPVPYDGTQHEAGNTQNNNPNEIILTSLPAENTDIENPNEIEVENTSNPNQIILTSLPVERTGMENTSSSDQIILDNLPVENPEEENPSNPSDINEIIPSEVITSEDHVAMQEKQQGLVETITSDLVETRYQIEFPVDAESNQEVEQQVIGHIITQNNEFVKNVTEEQSLSAHVGSGQQIVIAGQDLPEGTHHILLDAAEFQQVSGGQNDQGLAEGAIMLEDGTIIQPEEGDGGATDLLLYVLTTSEQQ